MNRRELLIGSAALVATGYPMPGVGSSSDPYTMPEALNTVAGNSNISGKTQVSPVLVGGENTGVIPVIGCSTTSNVVDTLFTPVNAKAEQANPYNGGIYRMAEPLLGCTTNLAQPLSGNVLTRIADSLITNAVYSRVIMQPLGVSGTIFSNWAAGGSVNGRIGAGYRRLASVGLVPTGFIIALGPNDTSAGTLQAAATTALASIISTIRGFAATTPIFVVKHSIFGLATSAAVQAAQAAVLDAPGHVYPGGDWDSLTGAGNYWDGTHFNATGSAAGSAKTVTDITAHP